MGDQHGGLPAKGESLRILGLIAENVKRIEIVEMRPDGGLVEIHGKNGSGKTSLLDAIWWALAGSRTIAAEPIRRGAETARVSLDLGDLIVTRIIRNTDAGVTTSLTVRNRDGAEYRRPQELIDGFFSALAMDPLVFLRMDAKDQFGLLRAFVPEIDFEAIEAANAADMAARRLLNAEVKQNRAVAAKFLMADEDDLPEAPISIEALERELEAAGRANGETEARRARREGFFQGVAERRERALANRAQAEELSARAREFEAAAQVFDQEANLMENQLNAAPPLPDAIVTGEIIGRLNRARGINTRIGVRHQRLESLEAAARAETRANDLTAAMQARRAAATGALASARLPVDGLTLSPEGGVFLAGLPFEQASDAEQLRASIGLAMAMNPRLRVIRVRDGSLLDADGMALIADMARSHGYQVWVERVGTDSPSGFEMVEGRLRQAGQPLEAHP